MTFTVRRIVTGHDTGGTSVILSDEHAAAVSRQVGAGIAGNEMWSTDQMTADNSGATLDVQCTGFVGRFNT